MKGNKCITKNNEMMANGQLTDNERANILSTTV